MKIKLCLAMFLLIAGCSSSYQGISVTPEQSGSLPDFKSFEVNAEKMPAFLGPIIVSNFSVAMAERGLQPVSEAGDAVVTLRYDQRNIEADDEHDGFEERIDQGGDVKFLAVIVVEFRAKGDDEVFWQGSIQRMHTIRPGDYMHTGRASVALLEAFRELMSGYPITGEVAP